MNNIITIKEFIKKNKNSNVKWKIDGSMFINAELIPDDLLQKHILNWIVNQWEGIIEINTEYCE